MAKDTNIIILGVAAVIAIICLVFLFQKALAGGVVHSFPQTYYVKTIPKAVQEFPKPVMYDPMLTYADSLLCDQQARLGNVINGFTWEATTTKQRAMREQGTTKVVCVDAPRQIADKVVACCQPPLPM
jgi:ABC-type cobalt transport system substrate-binding protein